MGKFSRSWQLVKQSFAILRSDKQLMLFPVLSAVACFVVTAIIATGGAFLMLPARAAALAAGERFNPNQSPMFLFGMFTLYVMNYFVIVFFNVALVGVANSRLVGGTWTFRDGIELAGERKGTIFQWALVAATVGVILRTLEERMGLIGRIIIVRSAPRNILLTILLIAFASPKHPHSRRNDTLSNVHYLLGRPGVTQDACSAS